MRSFMPRMSESVDSGAVNSEQDLLAGEGDCEL
jgi:hypothetical protein